MIVKLNFFLLNLHLKFQAVQWLLSGGNKLQNFICYTLYMQENLSLSKGRDGFPNTLKIYYL